MKKWKKILISLITVFVLAILPAESAILPGTVCVTEAAPRISSSKLTMIKGQSRTLKITGLKKGQKITWKSSNSKIVTVNKAGKLFAKSAGNATITAQVNGIRFVCKVKIQKKATPAKPTPTAAPKPGIKLKNHILNKGKKASDGSVKIELNTHDESKKIDMDLGGLGSSSSSMQVSVDEYRSITYIPKNNSFKFYFRFSSHDDLKSDITLTFPMNSTAASLNFYFYMSILPDDESGTLIATMSSSAPLSAIRNESSNLSFHFQKLTDPYEILTQKDASELANDTLDMAPASPCAPWAFQLQNKLFLKTDRAYPATPLAVTARGVVLSAASQPIPLILPDSFLIRASCLSAQQPARNSGLLPQHASASLPERSPSSVLFGSWIPDPF